MIGPPLFMVPITDRARPQVMILSYLRYNFPLKLARSLFVVLNITGDIHGFFLAFWRSSEFPRVVINIHNAHLSNA